VLLAALPCALATATLALGSGGETVSVSLAPLDLARVTRETLGLDPVAGPGLLAWAALWLAMSLGLRLVALPGTLSALRGAATPSALGAMALRMALGLLFRSPRRGPRRPESRQRRRVPVEQSGPLLWPAALAFRRLGGDSGRRAVVSRPSCSSRPRPLLQFVARKARTPPARLPA
jgi:hypothetical protein